MKILNFILFALIFGNLSTFANEQGWFVGGQEKTKKAPKTSINSAESLNHMPGPPAAPMRQSERKKPPQPDYLIGKVIWGESVTFNTGKDKYKELSDWNLAIKDVETFTQQLSDFGLSYHYAHVNLSTFAYDPQLMPALYFSGVRTIKLTDSQIRQLREYVLKGGMIICDSLYGSPYFYEQCKQLFAKAFPEETWRTIPLDHPIFSTYYDIEEVYFPTDPDRNKPFMEAIYIGSRVGVLCSRYGLGKGLEDDLAVFETLEERGLQPLYYEPEAAKALAANIGGYIVGYAEAGRIEGLPELFGLPDQRRPTDELVFAQIKHNGAWNVHPGAAPSLLNQLQTEAAVKVNLKRVPIDLEKDSLTDFPFLYLTGLDTIAFSDRERDVLKSFLLEGGRVFANNGLGLSTFHQSLVDELKRMFPNGALRDLPPEHDIYHILSSVTSVQYTESTRTSNPDIADKPHLQGFYVNGELALIYSPYDMEAGWLDARFPLMQGLENHSARTLGKNVITYILSH
ncbi:MAG: DUF4159 domain-containing protein [Verrucomicrobiota bacterium]